MIDRICRVAGEVTPQSFESLMRLRDCAHAKSWTISHDGVRVDVAVTVGSSCDSSAANPKCPNAFSSAVCVYAVRRPVSNAEGERRNAIVRVTLGVRDDATVAFVDRGGQVVRTILIELCPEGPVRNQKNLSVFSQACQMTHCGDGVARVSVVVEVLAEVTLRESKYGSVTATHYVVHTVEDRLFVESRHIGTVVTPASVIIASRMDELQNGSLPRHAIVDLSWFECVPNYLRVESKQYMMSVKALVDESMNVREEVGGFLVWGRSGVGKTSFFVGASESLSGAELIDGKIQGSWDDKWQNLQRCLNEKRPVILFVDEADCEPADKRFFQVLLDKIDDLVKSGVPSLVVLAGSAVGGMSQMVAKIENSDRGIDVLTRLAKRVSIPDLSSTEVVVAFCSALFRHAKKGGVSLSQCFVEWRLALALAGQGFENLRDVDRMAKEVALAKQMRGIPWSVSLADVESLGVLKADVLEIAKSRIIVAEWCELVWHRTKS